MANSYALFKDGKQVSKNHSTREAVLVEAFEIGAVVHYHADYFQDASKTTLDERYKIRKIKC